MGGYLNPGNEKFGEALNSQIYVDKTGLIEYTNRVMYSNQKYVCVSRPRRFGKSMAANMLAAYYSRGCDSRELFQGLKISKADACEKKLNQYNTIFLNMQEFLSQTSSMDEMLRLVKNQFYGICFLNIRILIILIKKILAGQCRMFTSRRNVRL